MGGLGNQLFQYAFALSLSERSGQEVVIDPNFAAIRLNETGAPELSKYNLSPNVILAEQTSYPVLIKKMVGLGIRLGLSHEKALNKYTLILVNRILELFLSVYFKDIVKVVFGRDNGFDESYSRKQYSSYFGYFQSHIFSSSPSVRNCLNILKPRIGSAVVDSFRDKAQIDAPLVVHIRLTDYRDESNFGIPSKDYYEKGITNQIQTGRYRKIWLFSDEPNEAPGFIPEKYRAIVENVSSLDLGTIETLEIMRLGYGYVIANSSFSWWGAYLSKKSDARIIYPDPWFSGMPTPHHLCPPEWVPLTR